MQKLFLPYWSKIFRLQIFIDDIKVLLTLNKKLVPGPKTLCLEQSFLDWC
jgi:hypothetical protein